jgi:hypothetical protein
MKKTNVNATLAIFFTAFAVVMIVVAGLTVIPTTPEAQAVKGKGAERISEQGGEHQSETGAENSDAAVYCYQGEAVEGTLFVCSTTREGCQEAHDNPLPGITSRTKCERFEEFPPGSLIVG